MTAETSSFHPGVLLLVLLGSVKLLAASCVGQAMSNSHGLALRGGRGAGPAVTAYSHGIGIEGVDPRGTFRQLDCHLSGLIVGADSMMCFNVGGLQNGSLSPQGESREALEPVSFSRSHSSYKKVTLFSSVYLVLCLLPAESKLLKAGSWFWSSACPELLDKSRALLTGSVQYTCSK